MPSTGIDKSSVLLITTEPAVTGRGLPAESVIFMPDSAISVSFSFAISGLLQDHSPVPVVPPVGFHTMPRSRES